MSKPSTAVNALYRISDPSGLAIIDVNVLGGWDLDSLLKFSHRNRIVVLDCLLSELFPACDLKHRNRLIQRMLKLKPIIGADLATHINGEITHQQPVGLLVHTSARGHTIAAQTALKICQNDPEADLFFKDFRNGETLHYEASWKKELMGLQEVFSPEHRRELKKVGKPRFLASLVSNEQELRNTALSKAQDFIDSAVRHGLPPPAPDLRKKLDSQWVLYRLGRAIVQYMCITAVDQPERINRTRLNQGIDLHYAALCHPGMVLLTNDGELGDVVRAIDASATIFSSPDQVR